MADKNEFDDAASSVMQGQATAIRNNIFNAVPQNPATVAQHSQIAGTLGIPLESVQSDPATAKQQAAMHAFDANKVVNQYPHLAEFLTDPTNAAKSHTDLPTLAATEQSVKGLPQPAPASAAPNWDGREFKPLPDQSPTIRDRLANLWSTYVGGPNAEQQHRAAGDAQANAILAARASDPSLVPPKGATPAQIAALNDKAWEASRQAIGGVSPVPQMFAENALKAASFGLVAPTVPTESHSWQSGVAGGAGQLAGFIAGPAKAAVAVLGKIPGASALTVGAGEAWATALLKETAAQAATLGLASGAQQTGSAVLDSHSVGEGVTSVVKATASGAATGALFGAAGRMLPDNTLAQWAGRFAGVSAAQDAMNGQNPLDDRPWQQKTFDYGQNAFFTLHGAGRTWGNWFTKDPAVQEGFAKAEQAARAVKAMQGLQALGELATKSELRTNDPAAFKAFVSKVTEDGHLPEVWIDGKTMVEALNQAGVSPDELGAKLPQLAAQLHEAMQTNGDVKISTADFATHIAGTPIEAAILPHLKTDPDGMTFSQGQEHLAQSQKDMADLAKSLTEKHAVLSRAQFEVENPTQNAGADPHLESIKAEIRGAQDSRKGLAIGTSGDGSVSVGAALDSKRSIKLDLTAEEKKAFKKAQALENLAETLEERAEAKKAVHEALRPAVERHTQPAEAPKEDAYTKYLQDEVAKGNEAARDKQLDIVRSEVQSQLDATGRYHPTAVAENASMLRALVDHISERTGKSPADIWKEHGFDLMAEGKGGLSQARPGALTIEGYNFGKSARTTLSGHNFGNGLAGNMRETFLNAADKRLSKRIYFYADKGTGINPEAGVGGIARRATLTNIYDSNSDPLRLRKGGQQAFESAVLDHGYSGYLDRLSGTQSAHVIMLGDNTIPVENLGPTSKTTGARVPEPTARASLGRDKTVDALNANNTLPSGFMPREAWANLLSKVAPQEHAALDAAGVFDGDQTKGMYKSDLIKAFEQNTDAPDYAATTLGQAGITKGKAGPENPGAGLEAGNKLGFWPALRVKLTGKFTPPKKPLILTGTTNGNAARQIGAIDTILAKFPKAAESAAEWTKMMAHALGSAEVPVPPYAFIRDLNGPGALDKLRTLTQGQIDDASHGFENAAEFRRAYTSGELGPETTGKLFLWSFLSRGVSPYTQESLFIDAFKGADKWITKAAAGEFTKADFPEFEAWAESIAPKGSGQPGAGALHNLNGFGRDFLFKMSRTGEDGRTHMQRLHDMMCDPNMTGKQIRREFATFGEGVGIDNKVVSFTLLVAGHTDVMVLDRVQIRQLFDDGRFNGVNLYDGIKGDDGKKLAGSSLNALAEGARGILVYEAIERALEGKLKDIYTQLGRPDDASVGRYHWETWVADSQQEASHGTLGAILADAKGDDQAISNVAAKQGEYGAYEYGALYNRDEAGTPGFSYDTPGGGHYEFSVPAFRAFLGDIKKSSNGVVPSGFKVTESGNAPWFNRTEVNREKLDALATYWADKAGGSGEGQRAIEQALQEQSAADSAGGAGEQQGDNGRGGELSGADTLKQSGDAGNGSGRPEGGSLAPLEGAPAVRGFHGPDARVVAVAERYARDRGIALKRQAEYAKVDPERAKRLADAYEAMPHAPQDPKVKEAYENLIRQTVDQYQALADAGYKFWFIDTNIPSNAEYASTPWNAMRDMRANQEMGVFPTTDGFGSSAEFNPENNPLFADTGIQWPVGGPDGPLKPVLANDLFRAVHDAFGHGIEGAGFRAEGEENAWQAHAKLFTGSALGAITSETRGQNSWLNYGPYGETNRAAQVEDTHFADQKTGLMPEWTWQEGRVADAPDTSDQGLNQPGDINRGFYDPVSRKMGLLKDADLSTFPHEVGHWWLETMVKLADSATAPADIKADIDTLLQQFKIEGATPEERLANWQGRDLNGKRDGHEQWAEWVERYMMEGKAPVPELQTLFSRFRGWLMNLYQSLPGTSYTPEVKGVLDRMFASQEAITQAERVRAYAVLDLAGESGPLVEQYKALGGEATEAAIAEMQARSLRDMKWLSNATGRALKALQRTAKDERDKITDEVTKEVMDSPVRQAEAYLAREGAIDPADREAFKVWDAKRTEAAEATAAQVKAETLERAPELKGLEKGQYLAKNKKAMDVETSRRMLDWERENERPKGTRDLGLERDVVAEMFGFTNGKELTKALKAAGPAKVEIQGKTDQRMLERHGDLTDPVSMQRAAEAAIHNEVRAKMMATGLKILTKSPMSVAEINKAAKAAADTAIAAKKVGELRPAQHSAAETKANKAMLKLAPKDPAGASQAQRAALLNNRLFKSASEAVEDVRKGLTYLKRLQRPAVRGKIDIDVRDQIDAILARFDLRANPTDTPTRAQMNLEKWIESQAAAGYSPTVTPEMLATEYRKPYREMTVEEFRGMVDTIRSMEHMGRERNTLTINGVKHQLADYVANKLVPKLQERGDNFTTEELYTSPEDRALNPLRLALDKLGSWMRGLNAQLKPQEFKRNAFDVHELLGPFGEALFDPVINANYNKVRMLKGLSDDFRAKAADLGRDWQKSLLEMLPNDKLVDAIAGKEAGETVYMKITRGKMVGLAIHVGNESNFDKLTKGYGWEPEKVWQFLHDNMTAKDWQAVQHVWDLYEKHWPDMAAMYRRLGQTTPDKIEARAFHTPFGEMRGGYAAIKYDPLRSRRGEKDAAGQAINPSEGLFGKDYFSRTATTNGSMNKRIDGYTDAIDLNFHTIERSLQESIHDLAYREALINANKLVENGEFRKAFFKAYGREDYRAIQDWIGRIANSDNSDRNVGALGRFLQYTRTGMVMTAIALRATTVLKHGGSAGIKTLAYFAGGGEKYLASRMASMGSDYANQIASAKEKFGEIHARLLQQDRDYRATASSMFEPEGLQSQAERFGHSAVAWADMMTAVPTAWAAYDRAIAEGIPTKQGGTGQPMTEAQAVSYANKIVREAHGSNVESARSNVMTAPSEALKMFTTLYGFMNNSYGQLADSINKFGTPGLGKPEILARTFGAIIVPALWAAYLSEGHKDGDSWLGWVAKAIAGEVAGTVPLVRDAWSMVEGFSHAGVIGAESWLSTMVHAGKDVVHLAQGKEVKKPIQDIADAVGMGLHIPGLGQLGKSAQHLSDMVRGKAPTPAGTLRDNLVVNTLMGAPKKD